jgi:hypothetical protein
MSSTNEESHTGTSTADDGDDDEFDIPMQSITDEEALLACRAYLQRKNKLGWKQHEARKHKLEHTSALSSTADEGAGYFWEDPSELKYLFTGRPRLSFEHEAPLDAFNEEDTDWRLDGNGASSNEYGEDEDDDAMFIEEEEEGDTYSFGFPSFPPASFALRSKNKKALFQDKEWKAKWYEARWGNYSDERAQERKAKRIEKYIQQIPSDILRSPELATLSDDDIEDAIRTYMVANKKRSISQKKRIERKRKMLRLCEKQPDSKDDGDSNSTSIPKSLPTLDAFMAQLEGGAASIKALEEQQRERSERAAKSYQTRLDHTPAVSRRKPRGEIKTLTQTGRPRRKTVRVSGAVTRTEGAIKEHTYPRSEDIDIILEPNRLTGRKDLLKEVLLTSFGMRGKCIPNLKNLGQEEMEEFYDCSSLADIEAMDKKFVTKSTVCELGCFIVFMLRVRGVQQTED